MLFCRDSMLPELLRKHRFTAITHGQVLTIINRIIGRLENIAQGDLADEIPITRSDELGRLNDADYYADASQGDDGRDCRVGGCDER